MIKSVLGVAVLVMPAVLLVSVSSSSLATQTPSEIIEGCGRSGPRADGQTGMGLGETVLRVQLPATGTFFSLPAPPDAAVSPALFICHVESGSSIILDPRTGAEVSRTVGDASGAAVLDQVAANARVEPIVVATPPGGKGPMTPPQTGGGGLKGG